MERQMVISVMSKDQPGIIAGVTGAIYELKGDLADLSQSILCGYLTMTLIATFEEEVSVEQVKDKLAGIMPDGNIETIVKEMKTPLPKHSTGLPKKTYIVTAQGKNQSGLVFGISSFCYRRNINILDLSTTLTDGQYTMILQIDLSKVGDIRKVREDLDNYARQTGMHVMMQHYDIFKVTNEVTLI